MLPLQGAQLQSLVRGLRSHMPHYRAKNKQKESVLGAVVYVEYIHLDRALASRSLLSGDMKPMK